MTLPTYAIEATNLADAQATGVGRYTRQLVEALSVLPVPPQEEFRLLQLYKGSRRGRRERLAQGPRLERQAWYGALWPPRRPGCQVLHIPDERTPPWRVPRVATVHDLYAALHINADDERKRQDKLRHYARLRDTCERLICISERTRQDFLAHVGGDPARLHVVHPGVSAQFRPHDEPEVRAVRDRLGLPRPYLLFVGTTPNKNLPRVLEALAEPGAGHESELAVAGSLSEAARAATLQQADALGLGGRVRLLGYVADADLPALYAGAVAYLFPSLYEGYGLPVLEAMASGTPVLTSDRGACPEVAAGHAVIVDPEDVGAMARGIREAVAMSPERRAAALAHARGKTWAATARGTLDVWQRVAAG